jgi:hypothetical protein
MEAKDTVMNKVQLDAIDLKNAESNFIDALYDTAREQAEISFKAGWKQGMDDSKALIQESTSELKQEGIKEVVEWLQTLVVGEKLLSGEVGQAKLKEWRIK